MKVALLASAFDPCSSSLERHVLALARGLALQDVEVELVAQDTAVRSPSVSEENGLVIRRFPYAGRGVRFAATPALREQIRHAAESSDILHIHARRGPLAVAAGGVASPRLVFTPHAPIQRLMRWPYAPMLRTIAERGAHILTLSHADAELIRDLFPRAAGRVLTMSRGVERDAIQTAAPFEHPGQVVLATGGLAGNGHVERVIAAMAGLDVRFRLVVIADPHTAVRLHRHANDLRVGERVEFVRRAPTPVLYRWLRTARVVVTLRDREASGGELLEALTAGAAVVASDTAAHREAAAVVGGAAVRFVSPECSPLELADAVAMAAEEGVSPAVEGLIPSDRAAAKDVLAVYRSLGAGGVSLRGASLNGNRRRRVSSE
jgi:glycosyltransferase involved in cell wall biosynthesis